MALKTTRWDPSERLDSKERIVGFLEAAFEDFDPKHIANAIGVVARARGMTEIAKETGLSREALYRALNDDGNPEFATIMKVLNALGLKLTVVPKDAA